MDKLRRGEEKAQSRLTLLERRLGAEWRQIRAGRPIGFSSGALAYADFRRTCLDGRWAASSAGVGIVDPRGHTSCFIIPSARGGHRGKCFVWPFYRSSRAGGHPAVP